MTKETKPKYDGLNIHQRLHAVMKDIDYVQKEDKKVNGQYTFVSHDAVTAKCRKAFIDNGIISVPTVVKHDKEWVTKKTQRGEITSMMTVIGVEIEFINIDRPNEVIKTSSVGYGIDDQDKGFGKAYSYAVKYGYLKALGLETGDDPEREIHEGVTPAQQLGNTLSMKPDREQQEQMHTQALQLINDCIDLDALGKLWAKHSKAWAKLDADLFADIEQKKDEAKQELTKG